MAMHTNTGETAGAQTDITALLFAREGDVFTHSRDVAEVFGKRHDNVLRDIERLDLPSDLRTAWFQPLTYEAADGTTRPAFDMTRQGFTFLVMGWTGAKAAAFKVRYIQAFDAMERVLRQAFDQAAFSRILGERVAPLLARMEHQDQAIRLMESRMAEVIAGHDRTRGIITTHAPMLLMLERRGVAQKKRGGLVRQCSYQLSRWFEAIGRSDAYRPEHGTGTRLFNLTLADQWFRFHGDTIIRRHQENLAGQTVMQFRPKAV